MVGTLDNMLNTIIPFLLIGAVIFIFRVPIGWIWSGIRDIIDKFKDKSEEAKEKIGEVKTKCIEYE